METGNDYQRCLAFINCQLQPAKGPLHLDPDSGRPVRMAVTFSRQTGSGTREIADRLADYLSEHDPQVCPWAVFDRNLIERVLEEHHLPNRLAAFLPEDRVSALRGIVEEILGLHPNVRTMISQTAETILHLLEIGRVIIIGWGAHMLAAQNPAVFRVRVVGSLDARVARVQASLQQSRTEALQYVEQSDLARSRYFLQHYKKHLEDPLLYDLVVNTDRIHPAEAAALIGAAVLNRATSLARTGVRSPAEMVQA